MTIKKLINNQQFFVDVENPDRTYIVYLDLTPEYFEIKCYHPETESLSEKTLYWYKITLEQLMLNPGFVEQSLWAVENTHTVVEQNNVTIANVNNHNLINVFANNVLDKPFSWVSPSDSYYSSPLYIFVPKTENATMQDFVYRIAEYEGQVFEYTGPAAEEVLNENVRLSELLSDITLSSESTTIEPDSSITVNVQTDTFIKQVYLEQVSGMLNKTRVNLTNGQGSFKLFSTGLDSGEQLRVKAGFKNFTGVADFSINVS